MHPLQYNLGAWALGGSTWLRCWAVLMQQCANLRFSLESQCMTISRQIYSKKTQNNTPLFPHLPPCSLQMSPRTKACPLATGFKETQYLLNFSLGLRGMEREGLGMTTQYFRGQITNPLLLWVTSAQYLPAGLQHLPPQDATASSHMHREDMDARRWPEDKTGYTCSYIHDIPPLFLSHTSNMTFHWSQGGRAASEEQAAPLFAMDYQSSWAPREPFWDTWALWGNTSVVLMLQQHSRETEALPCFTPKYHFHHSTGFPMQFKFLVPFGICY